MIAKDFTISLLDEIDMNLLKTKKARNVLFYI